MESKEGRISNTAIHSLCVSRSWFTCGSSEQYDELFKANEAGASISDIALIIWLCSDKETVTQESIIKTLREQGFTELCNVSEAERLSNWVGTEAPFDYKTLAGELIDNMCDVRGVGETVEYLLSCGVTSEELINELHFDKADVECVLGGEKIEKKLKIIAFDTEPTGFNATGTEEHPVPDEILQLSIVGEDDNGKPIKLFNEDFKPSDALIERRWDAAEKEEIEKILQECDVIVGYNGEFEVNIIINHY